jgi:hypothetical protein
LGENLGVRRRCISALHRYFGPDKAKFLVKRHDAISRCSKYPRHSAAITHDRVHQRATNAPPSMILRDDQHRNVAVRHPIGKGAQETDDFATLYRDD